MDVITYPCWDYSYTILVKGATGGYIMTYDAVAAKTIRCLFATVFS